jgi:MoxR-like ATPase
MNPMKHDLPSLDPLAILESEGSQGLARLLAATGYMVQERVLSDMVQAIKAGMPHLIEGPRGAGKTALAESLAEACNLPVFYLQGVEGLELEDVLYSWDCDGQSEFVRQALSTGIDLKAARAEQWSRDYLIFGEALGAYEFAGRENVVPILIVDEIDKLKDRIEDMLLQLFGRGYSHVPRFGDVGVKDSSRWPIVILLSNDIRHDLSAPMRSRCIYTWIDLPTPREGVRILRSRVPDAQAEMVKSVAKLLDCIRDIPGVVDKPALREGISLLKALTRDEVAMVDEPLLVEYLCHLAKRRGDRDYLLQSMARVEQMVNSPHREIDAWVAEEFSCRRRASLRAA